MSTPSSPHPSDSLPPSDGEAPAPPPRPRRRLRRALRWSGIGFGVLVGSTLFWSAVWTWYNPQVDLAKPRVVTRPAPPAGRDITLVLGGDFAPVDRFPPVAPRLGWGFPYRRTARLLRNADVTFLNLEAPITAHAKQFFLYKTYNYRVDPAALPAWDALGLDVVSLANNHVKDRRNQGLRDTLEHLRRVGIESVGAGTNEAAARRPLIIDVGARASAS